MVINTIMIKLKLNDNAPNDARIMQINGDDVFYYFDGDPEVVEMEKIRADEMLGYQRIQRKELRKQSINSATVTTTAGHVYDADEASQQRMHRAIDIMEENETIEWVLADNTSAHITRSELREALRLAFLKQASQWVAIDQK